MAINVFSYLKLFFITDILINSLWSVSGSGHVEVKYFL